MKMNRKNSFIDPLTGLKIMNRKIARAHNAREGCQVFIPINTYQHQRRLYLWIKHLGNRPKCHINR